MIDTGGTVGVARFAPVPECFRRVTERRGVGHSGPSTTVAPVPVNPSDDPATASGPASDTASFGRRLLALAVDWAACLGVTIFVFGGAGWLDDPRSSWFTLGLFVVESWLFTVLLGGSFGKLATRLRVVRTDGRGGLDPLRALLRSVLVALVVPPLVFRPDGRGLHDMAVGSRVVTI